MRTQAIEIFQFNELSEEAKKVARDEFRTWLNHTDIESEDIMMVYKSYLEERGLPAYDIEFSLSYSQGDGMAFYGDIEVEVVARHLYSMDELEHFMANVFPEIGSTYIARTSFSNHYSHYNTMDLNSSYNGKDGDDFNIFYDKLEEFIKSTSRHLEQVGYKIIDDMREDSSVEDGIEANEWEFTVDGHRWS